MSRLNVKQANDGAPNSGIRFLSAWSAFLSVFIGWAMLLVVSLPITAYAQMTATPDDGKALFNLAYQAYHQGLYAESAEKYERARAALTKQLGPEHPDTLSSMNNLAISYAALGRNADALKLREETLALQRSKLGAEHPDTLRSMHNLANSYSALGHQADALKLREETLALQRSKLGVDHPETLRSMRKLANSYAALGRKADALKLREETLALRRSKLGAEHPETLTSMNNLANSYAALGRKADALKLREETLALQRSKLGAEHPVTLGSMNNLAASYAALGRKADALKLREETLALRRSKLGTDHPHTLSSISNLADSYFSVKRFSEARDLRREALAIIDRMAVGYQELSREERSTALEQFQRHYSRFARDLSSDPGDREELLNVTERGKARSLLEELTARKAIASSGIPAEMSGKLSSLRGQLEFLDSKLSVAASNDERYGLRGERDRVRAELQAVEEKLVADYPRYAAMTAVAPVSLQQGQALIPTGGTFISWMLDDKGRGVALTLSDSGKINAVRIDLGKELALRASSVRWLVALPTDEYFAYATQSGVVSAWVDKDDVLYMADVGEKPADALSISPGRFAALRDRALASHGQWLSDKLLKPLDASINPAGKWILSPDGVLAVLPWDVLPWYGQPLGAQKQITLVQSLSVYKLLKDRQAEYQRVKYASQRQTLLAVGGAIYNAKSPNETCSASRGRSTAIRLSSNRSIDSGSPAMDVQASNAFRDMQNIKPSNLPCSLDEVNSLNAIVGGQKLIKAEASESRLRALSDSGSLARFGRLHFAVHGILNTSFPSLSAILLGKTGNDERNDGFITAGEWPAFNLKSDLLVMSACETGLGKIVSGEGVQGLPYALYVAGNRDTILTLWPIDDEGTSVFMKRFWSKVKSGQGHSQALAQSKRELMSGLAGKQFVSPFYWAPFVLYGLQED